MSARKLILDYAYGHEAARRDEVLLTQPIGGGAVVDYTWGETMRQARCMAAHLVSRGVAPGERVAILAKNSAHFFMAELAIWMAGGTTVAIFATESAETMRYVLEHSEASLLFVGKLDAWERQAPGVPAGLPCIALPLAPPTGFESWDAIVARTAPVEGRPARRAGDLAMLLYTSGTTGQPKGVMQTFESITRVAEGVIADYRTHYGKDCPTRILSYLPLAHCFERAWVECRSLVQGDSHVFFGESLATFVDDVKRARPTTFLSVPRLLTKIRQGVLATMPAAQLDAMLADPATAKAVGRKVLASLGLDAVVRAGTGSAPMPPDVLEWYRRLGLDLGEGYGMTEDFAYSHRSIPALHATGCVGAPFPDVEIRIADDGEVLIKSPGRLAGYYKRPDLDADCLTEDAFFRTGDLGERRADGLLKLTGRKKELFKTAKGKYVAPAPIEGRLNAHAMVELSIVSGVGQTMPYAIVVLAEQLRPKLGDAAVRERVEGELAGLLASVNADLPSWQQLSMLIVAREPWTVENGCLTATMKIKRSAIEAAVAPQVNAWYDHPSPVGWA